MAVANDTFTDTNGTVSTSHTPDSGGTITKHPNYTGVNEVQSNQMTNQIGSGGIDYYSAVPASADYAVEGLWSSSDSCGGPVGRLHTTLSTMYVVIYVAGASEWRLLSLVSGVGSTVIGTYSGDAPSTARVLKLDMVGTAIKLYIDAVLRISVTNSAVTAAGRAGYYLYGVNEFLDNWSSIESVGGGGIQPLRRREMMRRAA